MTLEEFYRKHSKITRSLKKFISEQQATFNENVFARFLEALSEELERVRLLIFRAPSGPERAAFIHQLVDAEIAAETTIPDSCQKGCSHCCHFEVEVTSDEAAILSQILEDGFAIDRARLALQSRRALQDPAWRSRQFKPDNRCVFLTKDEVCGIYDSRPVMCRRHTVTSPPAQCETSDEFISIRYFPRVDLIISAANEDPALSVGPLAKMIQMSPNQS